MLRFPPIPAPPSTTRAPVVEEVDGAELVITTLPALPAFKELSIPRLVILGCAAVCMVPYMFVIKLLVLVILEEITLPAVMLAETLAVVKFPSRTMLLCVVVLRLP